jgi:hypothetical protein
MRGPSHPNWGERNPAYIDSTKYGAVHAWVRRRKTRPKLCEECGVEPPRDLANTSGQYLRDLTDWQYLCRRCHMESDGRNKALRESGQSRKIPNGICPVCNTSFERLSAERTFCSRLCSNKNKIIVMTCLECQTKFRPKNANRRKARFCGHKCSAIFNWAARNGR